MSEQVKAIVVRARGMVLGGSLRLKDEIITLSEGHFEQYGPAGLGWVDRAPESAAKGKKAEKAAAPADEARGDPDATSTA